ncbi:MAG TPA: DUF1501 domain-containing protein [Ideonella sp.]|nr:DUF1501 domain-containing protein [Ideonella sp.]
MSSTISRRHLLRASLAGAALTPFSPWASLAFGAAPAANADANRMVVVVLRGGMDGLWAVPPVGDPDFAPARGPLAQFASAPLALDRTFALHPGLPKLHEMWGRNELAVLHAVGLPYRDRSHFDAQQVLESGGEKPYQLRTGWLGRALAAGGDRGVAMNTTVPLVLRGPKEVDNWAPSSMPDPSADLLARLERVYASDPALGAALLRARELHLGSATGGAISPGMAGGDNMAGPERGPLTALTRKAAEFLIQPKGPQVAVLEMNGWDSHANLTAPKSAYVNNLRLLDDNLALLRELLDAPGANGTWKRTVVVVATEFGREVAINGTNGSDHGTGGAAFVLGGAVKGGKVYADWPGLAKKDRYEGRDLRITTDLRGVFKGLLADHLQVAGAALNRDVFPGTDGMKGLDLLRA